MIGALAVRARSLGTLHHMIGWLTFKLIFRIVFAFRMEL